MLPPFKVSCAVCLLNDNPNGFVCMTSSSVDDLNKVIQRAKDVAHRKQNEPGGLHHDHAHFVCAIEIRSLANLQKQPKSTEYKQAILSQLQEGGAPMAPNAAAKVKMGHHLVTLLRILEGRKKKKDQNNKSHWMVLGYKTGPETWELDLPGGKRHLGESTSDCAIRETEEECSVAIDPKWISGDQVNALHDGECNVFYMIEPPTEQV